MGKNMSSKHGYSTKYALKKTTVHELTIRAHRSTFVGLEFEGSMQAAARVVIAETHAVPYILLICVCM